MAAAFHCDGFVVDAQEGVRGIASQHPRSYRGKVIGMRRLQMGMELTFVPMHGNPRATDKSAESARPKLTMVHGLQLVV